MAALCANWNVCITPVLRALIKRHPNTDVSLRCNKRHFSITCLNHMPSFSSESETTSSSEWSYIHTWSDASFKTDTVPTADGVSEFLDATEEPWPIVVRELK